MKRIRKSQAKTIQNASTSFLLEYSIALGEKDLDFCINTITGRYPMQGFCTNLECSEICYILEGSGTITMKNETISFSKGDVIFIDKGDIYFWNGDCKIIMVCSPAWYKEQCELLEE